MPVFLNTSDADFETAFTALLSAKREDSPDVDDTVAGIIADVRARGDAAVVAAQGRAVTEWQAEAGAVYDLLSAMAARLKSTGRTGSGQERQPDPDRQDRQPGGDQHR